jgi:APA family basic amino acid/polyamine antiporter
MARRHRLSGARGGGVPLTDQGPGQAGRPALARSLNLPLAVLFGLGVTVGAGIYVLIGAAAGRAGMHAPVAFLLAALVMAPTAASFAELAGRFPVSAGEAAYVKAGFKREWPALLVGLMVIATGVVSAAAISHGSAGYIQMLAPLPFAVIVPVLVVAMGAVASWGILQSVALAGIMTLVELGGLLTIIVIGLASSPDAIQRIPEAWTDLSSAPVLAGVLSATLLAFFAFIGFEGLANIAEEVKDPKRTLPRAIFLTLLISTLLYILVVWVALVAVPRADLAASLAPLSLVFERVTGASPWLISTVAVVATINGIIAQMVMASRVIYGLADRKLLPSFLAQVNERTRTPLVATAVTVALVLVLAVSFRLEGLAEMTARLSLSAFALVNAALAAIKWRREPPPAGGYVVPAWVPWVGCALCIALLLADLLGIGG